MNNPTATYCEELAERFGDLAVLLNEHIADNDTVLPHVFMGDVTRYVLADGSYRQQVVSFLEQNFRTGSRGIRDLIALSFVENLSTIDELNDALKGVDATSLRDEWHRQHA